MNLNTDRNVRRGTYARNALSGNSGMLEVHLLFVGAFYI